MKQRANAERDSGTYTCVHTFTQIIKHPHVTATSAVAEAGPPAAAAAAVMALAAAAVAEERVGRTDYG